MLRFEHHNPQPVRATPAPVSLQTATNESPKPEPAKTSPPTKTTSEPQPPGELQTTPVKTACKHGVKCLNLNPGHLQTRTHPLRPICSKGLSCQDYAPEHRILNQHPKEFVPGAFSFPQSQASPVVDVDVDELAHEFARGGWWNGKEFIQDDGYDFEDEYYDDDEFEHEFDEKDYLRYLEEEAKALEV